MPEILDVITRLQTTSDTKGAEQQLAVIDANIKAIDENAASITRLEALRDKTDKANIQRINQLNQAIENRKRKIEQETVTITRQIQANEKLRNSLAKQGIAAVQAGDRLDKLNKSSNSATIALANLGRVAQDAPFGFLGIANNLNPLLESFQRLRAESGSNATALKALGSSLVGAGGLGLAISVVSSLLVVFGDRLFRTAEAADAANDAYKDFLKTVASDVNNSIRAIKEQSNEVERLFTIASKGGQQGANAIRKLREEFPELTKALSDADIQAGKGEKSILSQVKATEAGNLAKKEQVELQIQLEESEKRLSKAREESGKAQTRLNTAQIAFDNAIGDRKDAAFNVLRRAQEDAANAKRRVDDLTNSVNNFRAGVSRAASTATAGTIASGELNQDRGRSTRSTRESRADDTRAALRLPEPSDLAELEREANDLLQLKKFIDDIYGDTPSSLSGENLIGGGKETPESRRLRAQLEIQQDIREKTEQDDKELEAKKTASLERIKTNYQQAANFIIETIQQIYDRQIALLDQEVQVRRDRVAQAVLLAEKGNTEILRQEQERLDEAQKKREEIARKQLQINALLQASSAAIAATQAIQTVTNAGATGDPYSTAARIAAAVAALAAGFAFVSNLVNAFKVDSFADGVVDYKGKGTERSDSNMVRISRGESVVTAKATKQYKPILEMMNKGIPLPITMAYPTTSKDSYKSLEKRLDALIALQEGNGINVKTAVTNGQIYTLVESQRKFESRRWR